MTFGLYDTLTNPHGCHIIREALYWKAKKPIVMGVESCNNTQKA